MMPGGLALDPERPTAAREVGGPPGTQGERQCLVVHPREHQHLAGVVLLNDRWDKARGVPLEPLGDVGGELDGLHGTDSPPRYVGSAIRPRRAQI
jgi:hypothetical protein